MNAANAAVPAHASAAVAVATATTATIDTINLLEYGIDYCGPFAGIKFLTSIWVPVLRPVASHTPSISTSDEYVRHMPDDTKEVHTFVILDSGTPGKGTCGDIEMVLKDGKYVLIRKFSRTGESLFCEACFQIAAWQVLRRHGLERMISRVTDVVKKPTGEVGFVMEPLLNVDTIGHFIGSRYGLHDKWIVSCLAQTALVLWILETTLGLNHRDLKGNNILVSEKEFAAGKLRVIHHGAVVTVRAYNRVHIVDFGFACGSGSQSERGLPVVATNYFPCTDPCPKMGRDLFQLCTFLYMSPQMRASLGAKLAALFEKWLTLPGKDFPAYLRSKREADTDWVYFLLSSSRFHAEACAPLTILHDIAREYPAIVQIDICDGDGDGGSGSGKTETKADAQ
jgi:hypothetical protein